MDCHYKNTPISTYNCDSPENGRLMVKLWEHFSTAAAGVCQLYREKLDQSSDFDCLVDALRPLDSFFKGSLHSFDVALGMGRVAGARRLRLDLRDLVQDNLVQTENVGAGDGQPYQVHVPLSVFLSNQQLAGSADNSLLSGAAVRAGSKRDRDFADSSSCARRRKRRSMRCCRCCHRCLRMTNNNSTSGVRTNESGPAVDYFSPAAVLTGRVDRRTTAAALGNPILRVPPAGGAPLVYRSLLGRRAWVTDEHHQQVAMTTSASDALLRDCLLSSAAVGRSRRSAVCRDHFQAFRDAVHVANLLDPLSKFSVTSQADKELDSVAKRPRLERPFVSTDSHDRSALGTHPSDSAFA